MDGQGRFHFVFEAVDYDATVGFYRDTLRLPIVGGWDRPADRGTLFGAASGIIEVVSDSFDWRGAKRQGVVIETPDADALFAEISARGGATVHMPPDDRPWGTREFVLLDPSGNAVTFFTDPGQAPETAPG